MVQFKPLLHLPTSEELPCSDDTPVDNELQNLVPNLLLNILAFLWQERQDWFFGVDMGIYYQDENESEGYKLIIPDGFLSIGVPRRSGKNGRLSYVLWEEKVSPILAIEVVSKTYNDEYEEKLEKYRDLGILYYLIYNPSYWQRDEHQPLELYRLEEGEYILQTEEPYWLPEIGLGIGRNRVTHLGWEREWLLWYNQEGEAYSLAEEAIEQMQQQLGKERQRAERAEKRAKEAQVKAEEERQLREKQQRQIVTQLDSMGLNAGQIAEACNLPLAEVRAILE
ncbi:MAG: Uma2 family endonuclease [Spirulinaceae cyanobacterium]